MRGNTRINEVHAKPPSRKDRKGVLSTVLFLCVSGVFVLLTLASSGCGGKEEEKPKAEIKSVTLVKPTPQTPKALEPPNALSGSAWKVGDFEILFRDNTRVLVKGGELGKLNPGGVEGRYWLKDGVLEISVMGQTRKGSFDDKGLIVEGAAGEKVK